MEGVPGTATAAQRPQFYSKSPSENTVSDAVATACSATATPKTQCIDAMWLTPFMAENLVIRCYIYIYKSQIFS